MKILYGCNNCSERKYIELFQNANIMISQQAQKYHSLLIEGLSQNGADVTCISGLPINRQLTPKIYIRGQNEVVNNVEYHYIGFLNFSFIRRLMLFIKAFFYILFNNGFDAVICDVLNISLTTGLLIGAKIRRVRTIGIVTDVPGHLSVMGKADITSLINFAILKYFNGYVFLTEAMNEVVNKYKRPYIVSEGHIDYKMENHENILAKKAMPKVLLYAGTLQKQYSIQVLTEAFINAEAANWELHVYGDGEYANELKKICENHHNIKFFGYKLNSEIVEAEINATILVNPRSTKEEYNKYSFPSKNMEYMASGTPVLTTLLPGMPHEYKKYVYLIEDESVIGITETLNKLFSMAPSDMHDLGQKAKQFVLQEKNNIKQAKGLIQLIEIIPLRCA